MQEVCFASENNTMMGMDKEKCMAMHKSMHENSTKTIKKEPSVIKSMKNFNSKIQNMEVDY